MFLPSYYNDKIIINTKTHFHKEEMLFKLFCIKNDFAKYFGDVLILFLYYRTNQISLGCLILQNAFSGTRLNQIVNKCLNS